MPNPDYSSESRRTAALAEQMQVPGYKRMMRIISDSYMSMARNDAVKMPQYERGA